MAGAVGRSLRLRDTLSIGRRKLQSRRHFYPRSTITRQSYRCGPFNTNSVGFCHESSSAYSLPPLVLSTRGISGINHLKQNRYDRFRTCLKTKPQTSDAKETAQNLMAVAKSTMEVLSSNRRSFHRTWARMSPLLELVVLACSHYCNQNDRENANKLTSIADVGCDHGILSLSLASMAFAWSQLTEGDKENNVVDGSFLSRVIGTDISTNALNGAIVSWHKINRSLSRQSKGDVDDNLSIEFINHSNMLPVDFRVGDGLLPLHTGEADAIILAGMGVHTMIEILTAKNDLDKLETNYLFLQPTNSRPRHLLMLYDALQNDGHRWVLTDESIVFVAGRWYISSYFKRRQSDAFESIPFRFPGHFLKEKACVDSRSTYVSYVAHHLNWLKQDYRSRREKLELDDERWIQYLCREEGGAYWGDACEWYNSINS
eukprot:CCRYP_014806-RA/>CCRYP_014806-RA protein AED:0.18 eAED:0.11 QI:0/-1/0/1/-1/1/1/0/429